MSKPTGEVMFEDETLTKKEFLKQFIDKIPDGTQLYSFITHKDSEDIDGTELGKIVNVGGCYISQYGEKC